MDRRDFVKLFGFAGLSVFVPSLLGRDAHAEDPTWGGPYFLQMHAGGGWDPTILCDAKLTAGGATPVYENALVTEVQNLNGIVVPVTARGGTAGTRKFLLRGANDSTIEDPLQFFQTVGKDVLVFNGVDTQTNNHETGVQGLACGHNDIELPALAALWAGQVAVQRNIPMAFLAAGQYNRTGDVIGLSRFPGDKVPLLAEPFKANSTDEKTLLPDIAVQRIIQLRAERNARLESGASLPRTKRTVKAFREATKGGVAINLLKSVAAPDPTLTIDRFAANLAPDTAAFLSAPVNGGNTRPRFLDFGAPLETILRCFQAGISASATFDQGGFDTHSNHDVNQQNAMGVFLARLRYVLLRAEQLGIRDKLYVMVTSDFGRTPRYNNTQSGKDHWNVTSMLLVGPGIRGGRAIGQTDEGHKALRVAPGNIAQILPDRDTNGVRIHPGHVHRELRRVLGLEQASFINQFPLPAGDQALPLLA
jgi:hypothetical protein